MGDANYPFHTVRRTIDNKYYVSVDGHYFAAKTRRRVVDLDSWTGKPKMIQKHFSHFCVQPTSLLCHKMMLYPIPPHQISPSYYLVIDPDEVDFSYVEIPSL